MWRLRLRRLIHGRRLHSAGLRSCWRAHLPSTSSAWREVAFLVVDAEMSSLDAASGELLSLGWVCIDGGAISLASARHHLVRPRGGVGQSAAIHNLRDCELGDALSPADVLDELLAAARGRVLVFHNAQLDLAFLDGIARESCGAPLLLPVVDTLLLEERLLRRRDHPLKAGDLRLATCRERYHLPQRQAHNALVDALSTAELLLAHAAHRNGITLGSLLR